MDALISLYLHIPFPEDLPDRVYYNKWEQLVWLAKKGLLKANI